MARDVARPGLVLDTSRRKTGLRVGGCIDLYAHERALAKTDGALIARELSHAFTRA